MAAVLRPNAPAPGTSGTPSPSSQSSANPPAVATSAPPQHKSFRQMARAPLETLRTVTRSKGKNKVSASVESVLTANEADFKSSLGLSSSSTTAKLHKDRDKTVSRDKGKERESRPRASIDTTSSQVVEERGGALRRLTSRTGLSFGRKSNDVPLEASTSGTSRTRTGGGWPSFMTPSQTTASVSTPTLHLNSDPNNDESHVTAPPTAVGASPHRPRRTTVSSKDSGAASGSTPTGSKKPPPTSTTGATRQAPPSPTTLLLASSSKNTGTSNKRLPPSPSTPSLPSYSNDAASPASVAAASPPRPIIRRSTEVRREPLPRSPSTRRIVGRGERSASRSGGSGSGSDSRSASPITPPNSTGLGRAGGRRPSITYAPSPSPTPRRSSDRRPSFEQRTRNFGSISATHLPLGAAPSSIPSQHSPLRTASRERHVPPPILTGQPSSPSPGLYQRRNSSSASFTRPSSPPSSSAPRTQSPVYKSHGRNPSTSSLVGVATISPQREAMRAAASFIVKEMSKPPPAVLKSFSPNGGLAGAPGGVKSDPWEEVDRRLGPLARRERLWARSGFSGMGTIGNASSVSVDATGVAIGGATVSGGGEEKERRAFCDALRDGYVLAQLMNKLSPTSSLAIPLVDPREDGISKTSNILKFREVAKEFIIKSGPEGKELVKEMFGKDDLAEGKIDGVTRVSRVITILASLKDSSLQRRWIPGKERREVSVARTSTEIDADSSMSGSGTITPGLSRSTATIVPKRVSPPSPIVVRSNGDANGEPLPKLDRRQSMDKHRKVGASPSFASPPTSPPPRPPISERRSSGGHYQLGQATPTSPPPAPPRSSLRNAPSFNSSNRASVASSAQTHATDHTNLFDAHRSSNRFGTIRTMNTIATDATSIHPDGSVNGSWGREDANNAMTALGLADSLDVADPPPPPAPLRRRSHDLKGVQQSGLGLALQSHPPVSSSDLFQDGGRPRRDRRSSEIAAPTDLTRVLEDPEKEGSIRPKGLNRRSSDNKGGLNFGHAKWPDDFVGRFNGKSAAPALPVRPATPDLDEDPFLAVTTLKDRSTSSGDRVPVLHENDVTPKGKVQANGSAPITIITAASRQVTPSEEKDDPNALSTSKHNLPYRRPTHHAASQSVDVLLPRPDRRVSAPRRISIDRRPSAEGSLQLKSEHMRESSSGSGESQTGVEQQQPIRRPLRRASTQSSRQAVYIPKRSSPSEDLGSSSVLLPAVASVPAVSHIRVPFPRTSSGEHQQPNQRESRKPRAAFPSESESTVRDFAPSPLQRDESVSRAGVMKSRPRHQSDLEATRLTLTRRGSSNLAPINTQRRGSHGTEDPIVAQRGRFDPSQNLGQGFASSTNLVRASSVASGVGSNMKRTIVVREEGRAPMHYQLGNPIGKGQFGTVYRALNINTGQIVAVKRIRLEGLPENEITQLMKEVDLLQRLRHPSIVQYEGMVRDEDSLDIVLEYVENGSLGQTLKAFGKFNEKLVATYVTKILEGLHYLHEQQVVHCDLKAANILSTKNGNIKLSDFGVSLTLNAMENAKETADNVAGTPNWMAPEVIELKGASYASDIWSLGCTVVELLTGKPPYSEIGNSLAVMFRIVEDPNPPIPEGCSENLRDFLSLCFKKDPKERPTAESLFEHPWLKRSWGLHKDLRPDDSVPFLRRISIDLQARQLSIQNLAEVARTQSTSPASPLTTSPGEPEFVVKPHSFVKTSFSKPITCKVCQQSVKKSAVLCKECNLICHATCAKNASSHCDFRTQLLLYSQYAQSGIGNGSPLVASTSAVPSPGPPPSPRPLDVPLSSSPSVNNGKFFVPPWKRLSKASTPDANSIMGGPDERGSQRRSGNFLFRRSEDRSRSRRDSMAGGSQNSASTRSAATRESQRSTSRMPGDMGQSRISTITFETEPELPVPQSTPVHASMQLVNDPARRPRRSRKDSRTDSKDCVIQ